MPFGPHKLEHRLKEVGTINLLVVATAVLQKITRKLNCIVQHESDTFALFSSVVFQRILAL